MASVPTTATRRDATSTRPASDPTPPSIGGSTPPTPRVSFRRDLPGAWRAVRKLLADPDDTTQVFVIMRALNGPLPARNFARLMKTPGGPRLVYRRVELAERFSDRAFVAGCAPGTVGAAYRAFLDETGYTAAGLAEVSNLDREPLVEHPYAWCRRLLRDVHDVWHVLTGYRADEPLGEAALVAFSFAQSGGLGWALIAGAAAVRSIRVTGRFAFAAAVFEGWRHGRRAAWLLGEDYEALLHEPLAAARERLRIAPPTRYERVRASLVADGTL